MLYVLKKIKRRKVLHSKLLKCVKNIYYSKYNMLLGHLFIIMFVEEKFAAPGNVRKSFQMTTINVRLRTSGQAAVVLLPSDNN